MFEDVDKKMPENKPESSFANPPQPAEDIFSEIQEEGANDKKIEKSIKMTNDKKGGLFKMIFIILFILVVAVAGLIAVSILFGFSGLNQIRDRASLLLNQATQKFIVSNENKNSDDIMPVEFSNNEKEVVASSSMDIVIKEEISSSIDLTVLDTDNDGLSDFDEDLLGTDLNISDTDSDGLLDGEEVNTFDTNPLKADTDGDGLSDYQEVKVYFTNPINQDTDGDTYLDGAEVEAGYNPNGLGKINQ